MKKAEQIPFVIFNVEHNEIPYQVTFTTRRLREIIESQEDSEYFQFTVDLENGESFHRKFELQTVMEQIKLAELQFNLIPSHLEDFLVDLTQQMSRNAREIPLIGRAEEIDKIWSCLSKKLKSNAILVGNPGVGKTSIALEIARKISKHQCPDEFSKSRVLMLNLSKILKIQSNFYFRGIVRKLEDFIKNKKEHIIIYIDNLLYMKYDEELIYMLNSMLMKHNIKLLSCISYENYENYFERDSSLNKYLNAIEIVEPEPEELYTIIKPHIFQNMKKYGVDISNTMINFAISTSVLSKSVSSQPAKVLDVLDRAFSEAKRKKKKHVDKKCIISCYDTFFKLYKNTSKKEKKRIAYHEAGHYLALRNCKKLSDIKIDFVSILPMLDFLGVNYYHKILGKKLNYSKECYKEEIVVDLAGRVAESMYSKEFSDGASSDLEHASNRARSMIMLYGLSDNPDSANQSYLYNYFLFDDFLITEKKKEEIEKEIVKLLKKGFKKAQKLLSKKPELLERLANELLKEEILIGPELDAICKEYE